MGMLNEFADTTNNDAAYFTAWTAAIVPGALDNYTPAVRLARQSFERHAAYYPYRVGLGAILLRAGQYDEAVKQLTGAADVATTRMTSAAYVSYLLAITHHRLGRATEAGKHLGEANLQAEQVLTDADDLPPWNRRLTLELLRREAETLAGKPANECNLLRADAEKVLENPAKDPPEKPGQEHAKGPTSSPPGGD